MATAILFTTIEAIRSCVGLDEADVPDELILNMNLRMQFTLDLATWYEGSYEDDWDNAAYDPTKTSATDIVTIDDSEKLGYLLSNYSMWFGAYRLIETMLAVPQKISDGKDEIQRFSGLNLDKMLERIANNLTSAKIFLVQEKTPTADTVLGMSRVSSETYDPITGS